jgi:hypothetical protein
MLNYHKNNYRSEKQIVSLHKITGPDGLGMIVEKGCPRLAMRMRLTNASQIILDRALAEANTQFQQ